MVRKEIFGLYAILIKENYPTKTALNFLGLFNFSRLLCLLFMCAIVVTMMMMMIPF